jgi:hypothetical protein
LRNVPITARNERSCNQGRIADGNITVRLEGASTGRFEE